MSGIIAKPRSKWVDIAKGITIAALVLIHIDYNFPDSKLFPTSILLGGVWRTPVFFVIGGFFIKEEEDKNIIFAVTVFRNTGSYTP